MTKILKHWWPSALMVCLVLWLTLARQPLPDGVKIMLFPHADKVAHALMMGALTAVVIFDAWRAYAKLTGRLILSIAIAVSLFSCLDEWAQHLTGRTSELADAISDMAGVIIVALLAWAKFARSKKSA